MLAMQKWQIFAQEWVEYPLLAMTAIVNAQCERTLTRSLFSLKDDWTIGETLSPIKSKHKIIQHNT